MDTFFVLASLKITRKHTKNFLILNLSTKQLTNTFLLMANTSPELCLLVSKSDSVLKRTLKITQARPFLFRGLRCSYLPPHHGQCRHKALMRVMTFF